MAKINKNIKRLREKNNLSQEDLAQKLFISRQAVSSWEVGRTQPDIEMIGKLSEIFNVPTEELLYGEKRNTALEESVRTKKTLSVVFAIVGSFLVGIGIMIILIGLWDEFSDIIKSFIAVIPLLIGQGIAAFVYKKKFDSITWREGGAILWSVGVIATVGLMSMVNKLYLGVTTCLLIDAVLILPIIYLFRVVSPLPFYFGFSISGIAGLVFDMRVEEYMVSPEYMLEKGNLINHLSFIVYFIPVALLVGLGIHAIYYNRDKLDFNALDISRWICVIAVLGAVIFGAVYFNSYGMIMFAFAAVYALGRRDSFYEANYSIGIVGMCIASLIFTFYYVDDNSFLYEFEVSSLDVSFFGGIIISIALACVGFILGRKNLEDKSLKLAFCCIGCVFGFILNLIEIPLFALIATVAFFVLTFVEGIVLVIKGVSDKKYFTMNVGIITNLILLFQILTYIDFTLITVGLMLLLSGGSLLGANVYISNQIKKDQAVLDSRVVDSDE